MHIHLLLISLAMTTTFTLTACGSDTDDDIQLNPDGEQADDIQLNPDGEQAFDDGQGGGDTAAIAGLWDGSITEGEAIDVIYWALDANGVLTRYDYQQDGALAANGENCYLVGNPISVFPEGDDDYSFFNVGTTAVVNDEALTITFIDADVNDLDNDGDTSEIPTLIWTMLNTPLVEDLNPCIEDETDVIENTDDTEAPSQSDDTMTRAQCSSEGGTIIGDIGDGAIHQPEYRCESGEPPIASITFLEGEPIASEGEVCCL